MTEASSGHKLKQYGAFAAVFLACLLLIPGHHALAEDHPRFTLETVSLDKERIVPKIWAVSTSIKILEPTSLSNPCDPVDGDVVIKDYGTKVMVKLKPRRIDPSASPTGAPCNRTKVPTGVLLTIPSMPFIPGCTHFISLETPERTVTDIVVIDW